MACYLSGLWYQYEEHQINDRHIFWFQMMMRMKIFLIVSDCQYIILITTNFCRIATRCTRITSYSYNFTFKNSTYQISEKLQFKKFLINQINQNNSPTKKA